MFLLKERWQELGAARLPESWHSERQDFSACLHKSHHAISGREFHQEMPNVLLLSLHFEEEEFWALVKELNESNSRFDNRNI